MQINRTCVNSNAKLWCHGPNKIGIILSELINIYHTQSQIINIHISESIEIKNKVVLY